MRFRRETTEKKSNERETPRPDRAELSAAIQSHGAPEGFNLEWICDRYKPCEDHR